MKIIADLRKQKKITQAKLAQIIGIGRSTLAMYETDGSEPDLATISKLADFFGVSVDYLLGREGKKLPENQKGTTTVNDLIQKLPQQYVDFLKNLEKKKGPIDYNKSVEPIFERFEQKGIMAERFLKLNETQKNALFNIICAFMESIE